MAEENRLGTTLTGLGNAATNPQLHHVRHSGVAHFHDAVSDISRGPPTENVGQQARVDGDPA